VVLWIFAGRSRSSQGEWLGSKPRTILSYRRLAQQVDLRRRTPSALIGGYIAGHLAGVPGLDVGVVARGPHRAAIRDRGLRVMTLEGYRARSGRAAMAGARARARAIGCVYWVGTKGTGQASSARTPRAQRSRIGAPASTRSYRVVALWRRP